MRALQRLANPLLIVGDNPALHGGLSRICRDLATLAATMPEFRVGVMGRGLGQNRKLPFIVYDYPESAQWGERILPTVWQDFAGDQPGIILTTDDPSRRFWFANPTGLSQDLQNFLGPHRDFYKWGYFPIDGVGPDGKSLPIIMRNTLAGYDRVLCASEWGMQVAKNGGCMHADWLPHGFFGDKFKAGSYRQAMPQWGDKLVVGSVMANQSRKDFPVLCQIFQELLYQYGNHFLGWIHTDVVQRYWDLPMLLLDYGLTQHVEVTSNLDDAALSMYYAAADCTVLPSGSEGFGYPILESLASGTACVVSGYSAGPGLVEQRCAIDPYCLRVDTAYNLQRAVLASSKFAKTAAFMAEQKRTDPETESGRLAATVEHLEWGKLRTLWERWFREGLRRL